METIDIEVINDSIIRLQLVRETLKLNKSDFARRVGSEQSHITKVLAGKANLGEHLILKIEQRLGLTPGWLETGEGTMFSTDDRRPSEPVNRLIDADKIRLETENKMLREQVDLLTKLLANKRID